MCQRDDPRWDGPTRDPPWPREIRRSSCQRCSVSPAAARAGQVLVERDGQALTLVEGCVDSGGRFVGLAPRTAIELCGAARGVPRRTGTVDVFDLRRFELTGGARVRKVAPCFPVEP